MLSAIASRGLYTYDTLSAPWAETGKDGVRQKMVRADREAGTSFGLIRFDKSVASGVHQHHGTASSLMLSGSLSDYQDDYAEGTVTINLAGTTHDAISWNGCLFVARMEGPVVYMPDTALTDAHQGSRHSMFSNPAPEKMPALDYQLRSVRQQTTAIGALSRRMLFDYLQTSDNHRFVELTLWPEMSIPTHRTKALTERMVLAGGVQINNDLVTGGGFVVLEPDTEVTISSPFGCRLLAWADGPIEWSDGHTRPDIYGF